MRTQTRNQEFKYQYKQLAVTNISFCGIGPRLNVSIPENLLDLKAIYMHAVLQFDASVASSKRKIYWAGGSYTYDYVTGVPYPTTDKMVNVNVSADPTTRIADMTIDLTPLKEQLMTNALIGSFEQPSIELNLITNVDGDFSTNGKVILWKVDFVYTTTGIQ